MVIDMILWLVGFLIKIVALVLPPIQVLPEIVFDAVGFFAGILARFDFLFPIETLFEALSFFLAFLIVYFSVKIITKALNYLRGTGSGLE